MISSYRIICLNGKHYELFSKMLIQKQSKYIPKLPKDPTPQTLSQNSYLSICLAPPKKEN